MTTKPEAFDHRITGDQAALIPDEIRADPDDRRAWVDQALEFGLKAMLQTAMVSTLPQSGRNSSTGRTASAGPRRP